METSLGKHKLRGFSSSSLICSECWFVFDSVWAGCIFLGICSFLCYPVGWYAVAGSIYGLVYMFALSGNASSFILILFIWVFSIFLVDSRKRFVDFIYLWNENNNKNQSTFCSIDFFLLYSVFFLIYFSWNLDFFPSPDFGVFFFSLPPGVEFETLLLCGGEFITVSSLAAFFWTL